VRRSRCGRFRFDGCFLSFEMPVRQPHNREQKKEYYRAAEEQSSERGTKICALLLSHSLYSVALCESDTLTFVMVSFCRMFFTTSNPLVTLPKMV
jgi:hypothetical protein